MATTIITNPDLFDLSSLDTALQLPTGTTAERPTSPTTGEWRFNTDVNYIEFWDGGFWRECSAAPIPNQSFETVTYTGNGSTQSISSLPFSPSFVWIKRIDATASHFLTFEKIDTGKQWSTNSCAGRTFNTNMITSFDSNGFTLGNNANVNTNGGSFVAWCFPINGGVSVTNTDGSKTTSVEVNNVSKISLITCSGDAISGSTRGHGLGVAPEFLFTRDQNNANCWYIWHKDLGPVSGNNYLQFSSSSQSSDTSIWNGTVPDDEVITVGNNANVNGSGRAFVTFAMASVDGFSKVSSYTGNGSANGPVINTGFQPAFIMVKGSTLGSQWSIIDNKRDTTNPASHKLYANLSNAEATADSLNFLSNGFQIITTDGTYNSNGDTYIYIAFAGEQSAAPVLADSFNTNLYTGNGTSQAVTGLGFSPSLVWIKQRDAVRGQNWYDVLRGPNNIIFSNTTGAQDTTSTEVLQAFNTDGFSLGNLSAVNASGGQYVSWNWKANSIPTINTDGSITNNVVSVNQAAGFSIIKYTGNGVNNATVGHGLSAAPELVINKGLSSTSNWRVASSGLANTNGYLKLNGNDAESTNLGNDGSITKGSLGATTITLTAGASTSNNINTSGSEYIMYAFRSVSGFSKIGTYVGTGGTSNSITGLGFEPSWVLIKDITTAKTWFTYDSKRIVSVGSNPGTPNARPYLLPASSGAENGATAYNVDLDSDGFTVPASNIELNGSGDTYIYLALKENPSTPAAIPTGEVAYLVVGAGGGAGGVGGGGGAGGLRTSYGNYTGGGQSAESNITLSAQTYTITIGAGGTASATGGAPNNDGNTGSNGTSSVFGTITSLGGGGGTGGGNTALSGGSGGGCRSGSPGSGTYGQGFDGATGDIGGGGGGAGGAGLSSTAGSCGAAGGPGLNVPITGATTYYAGGGSGGVSFASGCSATSGGIGGGGDAGANAGTANTGGGGGGGSWTNNANYTTQGGGNGGSGVAILRMNTTDYSGVTTGSPTVTTDGSYTILTYTGSGTYVHS